MSAEDDRSRDDRVQAGSRHALDRREEEAKVRGASERESGEHLPLADEPQRRPGRDVKEQRRAHDGQQEGRIDEKSGRGRIRDEAGAGDDHRPVVAPKIAIASR